MKFMKKRETVEDFTRISKYYLFGFIPILLKKRSPDCKRTYLLGIRISKRKYYCNIGGQLKNRLNIKTLFQKKRKSIDCKIDIVIPVYNGFNFLDNLFNSIEKNTDLNYRIFAVNDCSTDERIQPLLNNWNKVFGSKMTIINNETNLGFVKSVNAALKQTTNHVVLINTDVILPKNWASRLLYPIVTEQNVGSVTPFTNSAAIFSIPKMGQNNDFTGDLEEVNTVIQTINTPYQNIKLPTGVGFCMAMNRNIINNIGLLDEIFGRGYGEENDWCQRAIQRGYINTIAANLFVWHQHGGTFISDEKEKLIRDHMSILKKRYPRYDEDVQKTIGDGRFLSLRFIGEVLYFSAIAEKCEVWFTHTWGGGTEIYIKRQFDNLKADTLCIEVKNDKCNCTTLTFLYKDYSNSILIDMDDAVLILTHLKKVNRVVLNNLASYFDPIATLDKICYLKKKLNAKLSFLGHDLFPICPSINMINYENVYCNINNFSSCEKCFHKINTEGKMKVNCSIQKWHSAWNKFLSYEVDEIILFSKSTAEIFSKLYPKTAKKINILPHHVPELRRVKIKKHDGINIAVLGNIVNAAKGFNILKDINSIIMEYKDVKIISIGNLRKKLSHIRSTEGYSLDTLPDIIEDNDIDIVFIPSIWPETFSYTTSEAIMMGIPVACFDIGAPAERVANYSKGLIIDKFEAQYILGKIIDFVNRLKIKS